MTPSPDTTQTEQATSFSPSGKLAIETHGLSKCFEQRKAVDGLTISIPAGVIAGFVGPNGAGKTTTIRLLLGLVRPSAGSATILGQPLTHPERYLPRVGALIEAPAFYPSLSGRTNLEVLAHLGGYPRSRVSQLLELVELSDRGSDLVRKYSQGMKQRLGVAMALLPDPDLLILDEPANGLDPVGIIQMRDLLRHLRAQGIQTSAWTPSEGSRTFLAFFGNEVLCLVGISMLGMLIAVLTRSVGAAVGVALAYVLVPEGIIAMVWKEGSQWFPVRVLNFLPGSTFPPAVGPIPPQGYTTALLVALLWMAGFVVVSAVVFQRLDVNA